MSVDLGGQSKPGNAAFRDRVLLLLAFSCTYFVWGSTYLGIRYAVETIPPLFVASLRHLIAGGLLFAWCWFRGLRPTRQQWYASFALAVLFFLIGHGTLHWGQQYLPSSLAALLVAMEPIFVALMLTITGQSRFTPTLLVGLLFGIAGVALLVEPNVTIQRSALVSTIVILVGTASWSVGILYSRKAALHPDAIMAAGMSLLAGSLLLSIAGVVTGEASQLLAATISTRSLIALAYLTLMGSVISYSAYFWLLQRCSPTLVATHTYVNPLVALILGWAIAGETLSFRLLFAAAAIVSAIVLVSRSNSQEIQTKSKSRELAGSALHGREARAAERPG